MITKVHLEPTGLFSPAMVRIANALERYLPGGYRVTGRREDADLLVLYAIGADAIPTCADLHLRGRRYAIVQCCLQTSGAQPRDWYTAWRYADVVWSYYDLSACCEEAGGRFYHAPLGVDDVFKQRLQAANSGEDLVITSGHVDGPGAECISPVWAAARQARMRTVHVSTRDVHGAPAGAHPDEYRVPSDEHLARLYSRARFVAALRHGEGFELPAAEGLLCGARPILFGQPATMRWYGNLALFIRDQSDCNATYSSLVSLLSEGHQPVTEHERMAAAARFDWEAIANGFWAEVAASQRDGSGPGRPIYFTRDHRREVGV